MKILVPIDGSKNALEAVKYAADFAGKYDDASITLAYIIMYEPYFMDSPELIEKNGQDKAAAVVDEAKAACGDVTVNSIIEHGSSAADKIVDIAEEGEYDAIVMGSRGLSNIKRFLMGSVSTRVTQYAPCTVILVR